MDTLAVRQRMTGLHDADVLQRRNMVVFNADQAIMDAIAQQALATLYISRLAESVKDKKTAYRFKT